MIYRSPFPDVTLPEVPFTDFLLQRASELGDKPAFIDGSSGRELTYEALAHAVEKVAASLSERGFGKGDTFAIYSPNVPEFAVVFLAVARLGGRVTTVNPLYTSDELSQQLRDAGASYLITVPPFVDNALESAEDVSLKEVFVFGEAEGATPYRDLLQTDARAPDVAINPKEDILVLPYSSGTTGLSKGVMLTHYNLIANLKQIEAVQGETDTPVGEATVMLGLLPFFHIYGMVVIMGNALNRGATVVTLPKFDLEHFLEVMQNYKVAYAHLVPPVVLALAKHPLVDKYDLSSLTTIISGAAPLGGDTAGAAAARLGCEVAQAYGMTEMSPGSHFNPDSSAKIDRSKVGPALPNTECRIVSVETGEDVAVGKPGELLVRGPQMMKGYLNNPEATASTIDDEGWLHTGDIATVDENGYFSIVDRVKELIKYKGFQVAPAELEEILLSHPQVSDAAVIGIPDEEAGEVPKGFVVTSGNVNEDDILSFVAERVAPYKKLRALEVIDSIPKSASGKILRRVLSEREEQADR